MFSISERIAARREQVLIAYEAERAKNTRLFKDGNVKATAEYIFPNQKEDALDIVDKIYKNKRRVISIQKKTKVGADGLMIEIAKLLTTHSDDTFVVNPDNVRIITGMNNVKWEQDMIAKAPDCFKDKIYHHGKLSKVELDNIRNGLFIIDEIDTGDKESQVLHTILDNAGILDVKHMEEHNNRIIVISATMIKQLYDLYTWGELHESHTMRIPNSYIGHKDFVEKNIVKEFYDVNTKDAVEKWIQEDIIDNYTSPCMCIKCNPEQNQVKHEYRVHIIRVTAKNENIVRDACESKGIVFKNHTSTDRLTKDDEKQLFEDPLTNHTVIAVKGLMRRANLIPNFWKLRIGALFECFTKTVDNNVQIQGLVGRMTGYWRSDIEGGHKTGPYRTSVNAIKEYEAIYLNPFGNNSYHTSGFKKNKGKISAEATMLSSKNIKNLEAIDLPIVRQKGSNPIIIINLTEEDKNKFTIDNMLNILKNTNEEAYRKYSSYEKKHCWNIDTASKCEKYGLNSMTKNGAYSSETNIRDKKTDTLMFYLHDNRLIISAWTGEIEKEEEKKEEKEDEKKAKKEAKKAEKEAEKEAKKAEKEAEKEAKKAEKEAEKEAKKAEKEAEKEAKKAAKNKK